jgi:pimeloyl-ACP methyl ester carboxylesterase
MQNLLLLHGALGHAAQFEAILPLLKEKFTIYTFDFSGHGGKAIPDTMDMQYFAAETSNYINNTIGGQTHIFGHSMGGYVALYMARNVMAHIVKIMTLGTKLNWSPEIAANEAKILNTEKIKEKVPAFAQSLAAIHGNNWELLCQKTAEMMVGLGNNPALTNDDFTQIEHLVQLGLGDRDNMVTLDETATAYKQLPNGRLLVMPNTQHPYNKVNVERLAYEIVGFVG